MTSILTWDSACLSSWKQTYRRYIVASGLSPEKLGGIGTWTRENRGRDAGEERAGSGSSIFLKCSQISGVLNHSAIHVLGFFICCMNNMLHWQLLLSLWFQRLCMVYWQNKNNSFTCRNSFQGDRGVRTPYFPYFFYLCLRFVLLFYISQVFPNARVFYHVVTHGFGFFICYIILR